MVEEGRALDGIRIVDLTTVFLGPYCTSLLADLGADVVKVEPPEGDIVRYVGPSRNHGMGPIFLNVNRNKRSIVLDLKRSEARSAAMRLAASADVFIQSMRPGTIERLGLGYEQVAEVNPRVVYCSISGFNLDGANRDKPAYDDIIQASSGLATLQAQLNEGPPTYVASAIADKIVGMFAFGVILAALRHRERSGAGQRIDIPMHDTIAAFLMVEHLYGSTFCPPLSPPGYPRCLTPSRRPYQTSDGFVAVVIYSDQNWLDFFRIIGRPELLTDPRFRTITARTEYIDELYALVADELSKQPTGVWLQLLEGANIPATAVATLDDLISEQTEGESGLIGCVEHPSEGWIRDVAFPARLSASPGHRAEPAPRLGAQTGEILREAGLSSIEIERLLGCGAAACAGAAAPSPKDGGCEPGSSTTPAVASIARHDASS